MIERPRKGRNMTDPGQPDFQPDGDHQSDLAEEVRAFLVSIRGGAPFLSGSDGRLLIDWIEQGVPVAAILSAIERTAKRRAGRRMRTRLSLGACKGEVKKLAGLIAARPSGGAGSGLPPATSGLPALSREADRIAGLSLPPEAAAAQELLVAALRRLCTTGAAPEQVADAAAGAVRQFHETLWNDTHSLHEPLRQQARLTLAPLQAVVRESVFIDLLEEHTRQAVRALAPGVAVEPIWKALGYGAPQ